MAYPKGNNKPTHFSMFLEVAGSDILSIGWRRHAKVFFTIVNQFSDKLSQVEGQCFLMLNPMAYVSFLYCHALSRYANHEMKYVL